jgi:sugar phosphate isomerase/epimerase
MMAFLNKTFNGMKNKELLFLLPVLLLVLSCNSSSKKKDNSLLFSKNNLVAWCIVPFDTLKRTPEERATMLETLGIEKFAYDWRAEHLASFPDEIKALNHHHIKLQAVWMWIDSDSSDVIVDESNEKILSIIGENKVKTDLWVGFANRYYEGLTDEQKLNKAVKAMQYIEKRANELGCGVSLYNHGDWFGDPFNQIKIIEGTGSKELGIVYNFHHAHSQIEGFKTLLDKMLPYLKTVNLNGMKADGPKILPIGQGDEELAMLKTLKDSGYNGSIGILGHVSNEDVNLVLERNLNGLKGLLKQMNDEKALATY